MEQRWLVREITIVLSAAALVYGKERNASTNGHNSTSALAIGGFLRSPNVQVFIKAYNEGQFMPYNNQYSWMKYFNYMGQQYYINHTGENIEDTATRKLCTFSHSSAEYKATDELAINEDAWKFDTIKFYCPRYLSCCGLTCCTDTLPWWATVTIVACCMSLLGLLIYAIGRGFKTYENRRMSSRKDTVMAMEEKWMLEQQ